MATSLVSWREQDERFSVECKCSGGPLQMITSKDLVMDFSEHHSKDAKSANLESSSEKVASRNDSPNQGTMGDFFW